MDNPELYRLIGARVSKLYQESTMIERLGILETIKEVFALIHQAQILELSFPNQLTIVSPTIQNAVSDAITKTNALKVDTKHDGPHITGPEPVETFLPRDTGRNHIEDF